MYCTVYICAYEDRISIHFHYIRVSNDRIQKSMAKFGVTSKHASKNFSMRPKSFAAKNGQHMRRAAAAAAQSFQMKRNARNSSFNVRQLFVLYAVFQACQTRLVRLMCIFAVCQKNFFSQLT